MRSAFRVSGKGQGQGKESAVVHDASQRADETPGSVAIFAEGAGLEQIGRGCAAPRTFEQRAIVAVDGSPTGLEARA